MTNPRTYPSRFVGEVEAEARALERQRADLESMADASGQGAALWVAPVEVQATPGGGAYTSTTWVQGRVSVLARTDVVVLFEQPTSIDAPPCTTSVRWDVVARVCGRDCWSTIDRVVPARVITRRWPTPAQFEVLAALSLPPPPDPPVSSPNGGPVG